MTAPFRLRSRADFDAATVRAAADPAGFWADVAAPFTWHTPWATVLAGDFAAGRATWFAGARLNITENCLDRHLPARAHQPALIWEPNDPTAPGRTLTYQPIAWRIFTDNILNMGTKNWAEIFFIDEKNCVSAVLFHGYSVDNIFRLIEPLYYDDLTLADVVITAIAEKKENNKIQPKGVYYIATFSYKMANVEQTETLKQFASEVKIFRQETLTDIANIKTAMNYYNPFANVAEETVLLPAGQS